MFRPNHSTDLAIFSTLRRGVTTSNSISQALNRLHSEIALMKRRNPTFGTSPKPAPGIPEFLDSQIAAAKFIDLIENRLRAQAICAYTEFQWVPDLKHPHQSETLLIDHVEFQGPRGMMGWHPGRLINSEIRICTRSGHRRRIDLTIAPEEARGFPQIRNPLSERESGTALRGQPCGPVNEGRHQLKRKCWPYVFSK